MLFARERETPYMVHLSQTNKTSSVLLHGLLSFMWVFAASKFAWTYFVTDGDVNRTRSWFNHFRCMVLLATYAGICLAQLAAALFIAKQRTFRELLRLEYIKAVVTVANFAATMTIVLLLIGDEVPISTPVNAVVISNILNIFDNVRLKTAVYLHLLNFLCFACMELDEYIQNPTDTHPLGDTTLCILYGSVLPLSVAAFTECQSRLNFLQSNNQPQDDEVLGPFWALLAWYIRSASDKLQRLFQLTSREARPRPQSTRPVPAGRQ